jgi:hypothetical protein
MSEPDWADKRAAEFLTRKHPANTRADPWIASLAALLREVAEWSANETNEEWVRGRKLLLGDVRRVVEEKRRSYEKRRPCGLVTTEQEVCNEILRHLEKL